MMNLNIEIEKIVVLLTDTPDEIFIHTNKCGFTRPFPAFPEQTLTLKFECAQNHGIQYVRDNFDVEPEVIENAKNHRGCHDHERAGAEIEIAPEVDRVRIGGQEE